MIKHPDKIDKNPSMEDVLQRWNKVRDVIIRQNRQILVIFIH